MTTVPEPLRLRLQVLVNDRESYDELIALLEGGGGGGFTPPDEFWVDQNLAPGTYPTIAAALAAVVNEGSILHLHGSQTHEWDIAASDTLAELFGRVDFLSYNGAATLLDAGGDFVTEAVLGFSDVNLDIGFTSGTQVAVGCRATFENCTGYFGDCSAGTPILFVGLPEGGYPSLTWNNCDLTGSAYRVGAGAGNPDPFDGNSGKVTWNRCTVPFTNGGEGAHFVYDDTSTTTRWTLNACQFEPVVAGGIAVFETTETDGEVSALDVTFNDCLITATGDGDAYMAALNTTTYITYNDTRIINNAANSTLVFDGASGGTGSTILKAGDFQVDGFGFPLPLPSVFGRAVTEYGTATFFSSAIGFPNKAWMLPGLVFPMRAYTTLAAPSMALTSLLDQKPVVPTGDVYIVHIRGDIVVAHTSPFGGGAHFSVDVTLSLSAGAYTVVAGGVAAPDYDTSGGQYSVTINSVTDEGVEFLCGQGTYGNESQWNATLQVVN